MDQEFDEFLKTATPRALRWALDDAARMLCVETRRRRTWRLCDQLQMRKERGEC